jgi:hypothetical protein
MIKLELSNDQFKRAEKLYDFKALNNSITKGESNIFGAIGEIMVNDYFVGKGADVDFKSTYDYDMIIDGYKVDVKCKATNYQPKDYFNCAIPAIQARQKCDFYFFTFATYDFKTCYLAGYKQKADYFKESRFVKKGEIDHSNWEFKADNYILTIGNITKFSY